MTHNQARHHRRSIRLKGYDYARSGAYFVTVCAQGRTCLFGEVVNGVMRANNAGRMLEAVWDDLPVFYRGVDIDAFAVMPNHIHGIIVLVGAAPRGRPGIGADGRPDSGQAQGPAPTGLSLGEVVRRFKTMTTKRYADGVENLGWPAFPGRLWQRNYYEHVIRDDESLDRIRRYIVDNPARWAVDRDNPLAAAPEPEAAWRA
jgi:REP element-mobilizing transposase RayT